METMFRTTGGKWQKQKEPRILIGSFAKWLKATILKNATAILILYRNHRGGNHM